MASHNFDDRGRTTIDLLTLETADALKSLKSLNGLTDGDLDKIAAVILNQTKTCQIQLFEHQKKHYEIIEQLREMELKVAREHLNFQKFNKEHGARLKTILNISKK